MAEVRPAIAWSWDKNNYERFGSLTVLVARALDQRARS